MGAAYKTWANSKRKLAMIVAVVGMLLPVYGWANSSVFAATATSVADLPAAVAAANNGDVIRVVGTGTLTSNIIINKDITIRGASGAAIDTTGNTQLFTIVAGGQGTTIENLTFDKTDSTNPGSVNQNLIGIQTDNVTIRHNTFEGTFVIGDNGVSRAVEVSPSVQNFAIRANTMSGLRQPAYINDNATGTVADNTVTGTKGWVVLSDSDVKFTGNHWGVAPATRNVNDIAIIAGPTNNYPDSKVVQMSNQNNDAVIENQFGGTPVLSDAFVDASAPSGGNGLPLTPYNTISPAFERIVAGGTIHVANGTYSEALSVKKEGTQLVGQSEAGVIISPLSNSYGQGLTDEGFSHVTFSNFTVNAVNGGGGYAVKAHNGTDFTVQNVMINGSAVTAKMGGLDISGMNRVILSNVSVSNFKKNGISFDARFSATDPLTRNIALNNISVTDNAWAGLAFYTSNNAGTVRGNITNVSFTGNNVFARNGTEGIFIEGDTDANFGLQATPRNKVTGPNGTTLDLGSATFTGNGLDIVNYQTSDVAALNAIFSGKTGNQMTTAERAAEDAKIVDKNDVATYGSVVYQNAPAVDAGTGNNSGGSGAGGNTSGASSNSGTSGAASTPSTPTASVSTQKPASTPASTSSLATGVLGDATTTPSSTTTDQGASDVKGDSTTNKTADAVAPNGNVLGLAWYWWLIILLALVAIIWWIIASTRRRNAGE